MKRDKHVETQIREVSNVVMSAPVKARSTAPGRNISSQATSRTITDHKIQYIQ